MTDFSPREIVSELDRFIIGQGNAKRADRYLRQREAMLVVADAQVSLVLTGTGDVLGPENGVMGIGSGGNRNVTIETVKGA